MTVRRYVAKIELLIYLYIRKIDLTVKFLYECVKIELLIYLYVKLI